MKRREFITALSGAAVWPVVARAQRQQQMRMLASLVGGPDDDTVQKFRATFRASLEQLGWNEGRTLRVERRVADDRTLMRAFAKELVALSPDVIFAVANPAVSAFLAETRSIPVVFALVADPIAAGFVSNLARPGGNVTGFTIYDHSISTKWLELLKEAAPDIKYVVAMYSPAGFAMESYARAIESVAQRAGVRFDSVVVSSDEEIGSAIAALGREPGGGLIVLPDAVTISHSRTIIAETVRNVVPAIYPTVEFGARNGGLISYGPDLHDIMIRAASYVDRILRGERPGELPVQQPTKYLLTINLKSARSMGLTVPESMLLGADEVIE
jgi:putative tryptophan/tyrosine transport system substrate-binding protein